MLKERLMAITVRELEGVAPELALLEFDRGKPYTLYIAEGVFRQLPEHPLHASFYRSPQRPRLDRGHTRRRARTVRGKVARTNEGGGYLVISAGRSQKFWRIDARTRIASETLAGVPRLRHGQVVGVRGLRCGPHRFVARTVQAG